MRTKNRQSLSFFIALLLFIPLFTNAQEQHKRAEQQEISNQLLNCEMELALQDGVINAATKQTNLGGVLIVLARLGNGENSHELIRRRLYNARQFIKERGGRLASEKIVVAEGEPVKGYGRLEYYIGGELYQQLLFRKNRYICQSCCGDSFDKRFYPDKEFYDRQQKQKRKRKKRY